VKFFFPLVVLFAVPCLYSEPGLFFPLPDGENFSRSVGNESAGFSGFSGLFRIPDFESPRLFRPRLTNLASTNDPSAAEGENPVKAASLTPLWLKDLRRAEIVAFGSFPLTMFWTSFLMDLFRTASHGWDNRYAPWPFKGAGAVAMTNQELSMMFTIAISSSVVIAVVDHFIVRHRRSKAGAGSGPVRLDKKPASSRAVIVPEG
jgi:hypothetical protein